MRLASRIAAGYGLVIAVMAGMGAYQLELIRGLEATNRTLSGVSLAAIGSVLGIRRNVEQLRQLTQKMFVLGDPDYATALGELRDHVAGEVAGLSSVFQVNLVMAIALCLVIILHTFSSTPV